MNIHAANRECGIRHKFVVRFRDRRPNRYPEAMESLIRWCTVFDREGMAPIEGGASAGNLSFRTPSGFVITPTRSQLKVGLNWHDFVEVVRANWHDYEVHVLGDRAPSSDTFLHERIYALRPDVMAVFHGHDEVILRQGHALKALDPSLALTSAERLFGTKDDAAETAHDLQSSHAIIRLGHGFVTVGRHQDQAGERALALHRSAVALTAR
ncbi:MAG TPA: class II aldolase/adducin family protein [Planctomycetota bacterium]|jgi:ribulose-5-phosphate 4-epimerase/fuculose-1-phosphate aldolase|nr:class II aldolase/adducin family protein [Planctomycetota bacterium]